MAKAAKLAKKESDLFRTLINCYENKQYQKGLKTADLILKKHPNHGETQAMKGLIHNCLDNKKEAYDLVKEGLKNDVRSHVCWHVYGLLHRSDNNYGEAIKCYLNALRIDSSNQNILRDLATLQVQMRDYAGFLESRRKILLVKPTLRTSWVAYAVATYMTGDYKQCFAKISEYFDSKMIVDRAEAYEEGELLLFQNKCLEQMGDYAQAMAHLATHKARIKDKFFCDIKYAELLLLLGRFDEAKAAWNEMLKQQPDNFRFHTRFQTAVLQLDEGTAKRMLQLKRLELPSIVLPLQREQRQLLKDAYAAGQYRTRNLQKILLTFCNTSNSATAEETAELRGMLDEYLKMNLRKAVPSLCHDVCSLMTQATHAGEGACIGYVTDCQDVAQHPVYTIAMSLINDYLTTLKETGRLPGESKDSDRESPSVLLWALYLKGHLLEAAGQLEEALQAIEESIAHTPTALDMHLKRARLLRKSGDIASAAVTMDDARALDLQDRYLNNKATKYFLRADEMELAMATIAMFTKHDGDPQKSLYDLQCTWYELEAGESFARTKKWGAALRKFYAVRKHFQDYIADTFDFHGYCLRKTTLRAYVDVLQYNNQLYSHKFYQRAVRGALRVFVHLLDSPEDVDGLGHLPPAERKKERAKLKKAKKRAEEEARKEDEDGLLLVIPQEQKKKDSDEPDEEELLQRDFAAEAAVWCQSVQPHLDCCDGATVALYVEIMMKRAEYMAAVEALRTGLRGNPQDAELLCALARVANKVKNPSKKQAAIPDAAAVKKALASLLQGDQLQSNADQQNSSSSEAAVESKGASDSDSPDTAAAVAATAAAAEKPVSLDIGSFVARFKESVAVSGTMAQRLAALRAVCAVEKAGSDTIRAAAAELLGADSGVWTSSGIEIDTTLDVMKFLTAQLPDDAVTGAFAAQAKAVFPRAAAFSPLHTVATIRAEADVAASKVATYSDEVAGAADKVATLAISDGAKD